METIVEKLVACLCTKYRMFGEEAYSIIYNEWEFIEQMLESGVKEKKICEKIAKELIELYMVA